MLLPSRMAKNEPDYPLSDRLLEGAMGTTVSLLLPEPWTHAGTEAVRVLFAQWEHVESLPPRERVVTP